MTPTAMKAVNSRATTGRYPGATVKKVNFGGKKYTTPKAPKNVASRPGPKPPRIPLAATAKVNNNSKACSCRSGSNNILKANATARQMPRRSTPPQTHTVWAPNQEMGERTVETAFPPLRYNDPQNRECWLVSLHHGSKKLLPLSRCLGVYT